MLLIKQTEQQEVRIKFFLKNERRQKKKTDFLSHGFTGMAIKEQVL